jgi:hypothetical protein
MKRLLLLLVTVSFIVGPEPVSVVRLDPAVETAEARPGGRGGGFRGGGGRAAGGMRTGGARMSTGRPSVSRPSYSQPSGGRRDGISASRPSTRPSRPPASSPRPSTLPGGSPRFGLGDPARPGTLPARPSTLPARPADGARPGVRPPISDRPRPSHPIALPPGSRPPGYRPPGWRPPEWRPPYYPPPYPRPPHWYWGDYNYWPEWGWFFTGAVAGATLVYVAELEDEECEEVTYQGERLYLCDGVLYRATMYKDEPVYEIVTEPDEVIAAGGSVGAYEDDRPLMLTSPRMQGDRVLDLQHALADRGFDPGSADGVFGPATDRALRDFQRDAGLDETGMLDEPTQAALAL